MSFQGNAFQHNALQTAIPGAAAFELTILPGTITLQGQSISFTVSGIAPTQSAGLGSGGGWRFPRRRSAEWSRHITELQRSDEARRKQAAERLDAIVAETVNALEARAIRKDVVVGLPQEIVTKANSLREAAHEVAERETVNELAVARIAAMSARLQEMLAKAEAQIEEWEQDDEEAVLLLAA